MAALFCRMTTYAEVGAASLSHFPPRRLRWIVEGEVDGTDAADRDPLPARCHQSADASRFHSSGSPALRKPSNTGGRFGVCAIIHFTVSLGLRRRASVFGQRTNDGFALPGPACFGAIGERLLFARSGRPESTDIVEKLGN